MAKSKKSARRLDPDDVLEGRARPGARELLALIHEVNPTGHELPAKESARRYAQKSRLQSLLVRRFPDEIVVEAAEEPGVVGLRHRASGVDACHAVLASLDVDARSWVQRCLDLGHEEEVPASLTPVSEPVSLGPPSGAPLSEFTTDELLARGRAALEAYDYEAARERFAAALDRGRVEAAPLLLSVLVDALGLDEDALRVEERLDDKALRDPEVRLRLALSAARRYERARAERHARSDVGDAAAEVFVVLAGGALARGELDSAGRDVAEIQRRSPSHPALRDLSEQLKQRRAAERAPLEEEARRLGDEGRFDEAEARAQAILGRWPESAAARAIVRAGEERRREEQARALAAEGRAALAQGESARAVGLLRKALALGLPPDAAAVAEGALAQAEAEARARQAREETAAVARVLREGHTLRGLTEYAALDAERRREVAAQVQLAELAYLDQIGTVLPSDAKAAAQAVMALVQALGALTAKDFSRVAELVGAHWRFLQVVPNATRVLALADEHARTLRQVAANQRLLDAMGAVRTHDRDSLVRSVKLFESVRREDLDEEGQADLDRYSVLMRRMLERWDRAHRIGKLRKEGRLVEALDLLDEMIAFERSGPIDTEAESGDDDRKIRGYEWPRMRSDVVRLIAKSADIREGGPPEPDALLGQEAPQLHGVPQSILPGGEGIVLAEAHGCFIFVQVLDLASGCVERRASMHMREPLDLYRVQHHGDRTYLLGGPRGTTLGFVASRWEIRDGRSFSSAHGSPDDTLLAPGGRFVWQCRVNDGWWSVVSVDDTTGGMNARQWKEVTPGISVHPLYGLEEPRVLVLADGGCLAQYESRGARVAGTQQVVPAMPGGIAVHPNGQGLFALVRDDPPDLPDPPRATQVRWAELSPLGAPLSIHDGAASGPKPRAPAEPIPAGEDRIVEGLDPAGSHQVALALGVRMVFVLYTTPGGVRRLLGLGLRPSSDRLEPRFSVEVPARLTLAQDEGARTVIALSPHARGIEAVPLGVEPPAFRVAPPAEAPLDAPDFSLVPPRPCASREMRLWSAIGQSSPHEVSFALMLGSAAKERREILAGVVSERERLVACHAALQALPLQTLAEEFAEIVRTRLPGTSEAALIAAQRAAFAGRWAEVRELLAPLDLGSLDDAAAQHHDHLLGAALLALGEVAEARRVLCRGAARAGGCCDLSVPLALVEASDPAPALRRRPVHDAVRALHRALRAADARLALGDARGARQALSGLVVREAREVQILARLSRAWLAEPEDAEVDTFARRLALAAFPVAHAEKRPGFRRELPFPGLRWETAKLDALAEEASRWLVAEAKAGGAPA